MSRRSLFFTGERSVEVRDRPVPETEAGEVLVRTERTAMSPGTELLVYRGEISAGAAADETIEALDGEFSYPLQYGYAAVGRVAETGADVGEEWLDRRVFAFNPHESHFTADPEALVPTTLAPERALFVPTVEAAVNFVMDARPRIGSGVVVFGQGSIGLTTALLAEFPLAELVTVDYDEKRRAVSESFGADRAVSPDAVESVLSEPADVSLELSGNPEALGEAIDVAGFAGRVIVGSWYETKDVSLRLDEQYHRSHVRVRSSQVSRIDPDHADRWDKRRRMEYVTSWLADADLSPVLTHEFEIGDAKRAYRVVDERRDGVIQAAFRYE
ncbi:zinc-binding dehydrogenase [Saliphagus infecundisoli]|uniref:Zinc-binding dehydrogenase n=1 Tax=Saliphagus infecundisoli TaxID=1849069 RepID=A0ABD5QFS5_9EURY|nr:zinc-binding alcohol dehydrogenase [Saliphagus infecundisoli]